MSPELAALIAQVRARISDSSIPALTLDSESLQLPTAPLISIHNALYQILAILYRCEPTLSVDRVQPLIDKSLNFYLANCLDGNALLVYPTQAQFAATPISCCCGIILQPSGGLLVRHCHNCSDSNQRTKLGWYLHKLYVALGFDYFPPIAVEANCELLLSKVIYDCHRNNTTPRRPSHLSD